MADKIVMGYWDCKYYGTTGIAGIKRDCPNCGHPRDKDTKFYMKSQNHEEILQNNDYLTDEQAKTKGKGADWECTFCGSLNSALSANCKSCGHSREESSLNYFQMREREDQQSGQNTDDSVEKVRAEQPVSPQGLHSDLPKGKQILLAIIAVLVLLGIIWSASPHRKNLHVISKEWEYVLDIEEYRYVPDSGWSLPLGADLNRTAQEIHHYNTVLDHYETKTRTYRERVQSGFHTEYSYSDNGDGTFTEHSRSVPDYEYVTREETYQDPVYIQVPVYQTKYYYHLWRWEYSRSVRTSGINNEPYFGDPELQEREQESGSETFYYLNCTDGKKADSKKKYEVDEMDWFLIDVGSDIRAKVQGSRIVEITDP